MTTIFEATDKSSPGHYGPSQTVLLLLDFHSVFVQSAGGPNAPAALQAAIKMRIWAKAQGIEVIHCLIDVHETPHPCCKGVDKLSGVLAALKESGGEESAELRKGAESEVTFTRVPGHVSALKSPGLENYLQNRDIKSLILTGLSTSGCVLRTAVSASDAEFVVTVISDACADSNTVVHNMLMESILTNRGYVTTVNDFQQGYAKITEGK